MSDMLAPTGNVPLRGLEMFEKHVSVHVRNVGRYRDDDNVERKPK
jgi:hypothetical protein